VLDIVIDDGLSDIVAGRFDGRHSRRGAPREDMIAVRLTPDVKMLASRHPTILRAAASQDPRRSSPACCINWRFPGSGKIYRWEFEKKRKKLEMAVAGP